MRDKQIFQLFLLAEVQHVSSVENRPASNIFLVFFCRLDQKLDQSQDIEWTTPGRLSFGKLLITKFIIILIILQYSCKAALRVLQNCFEIEMRTAEKRLILQHILEHITTIFAHPAYPMIDALLLSAINSLWNPLAHKKSFSLLLTSNHHVSALPSLQDLEVLQCDRTLSRSARWIRIGLRCVLHDATHLNSYYINVRTIIYNFPVFYGCDNITSCKIMLGEDLLDLLKHLIWFHLRIHVIVLVQLRVVLYYLLGLVLIGHKSLLDAVNVIV